MAGGKLPPQALGLGAERRRSSWKGPSACGGSPSSHAWALKASPGSATPTIRSRASPWAASHAWMTIDRTRHASPRRRRTACTPRTASGGAGGGAGGVKAASRPPVRSLRRVRPAALHAHHAARRLRRSNRRIAGRAGARATVARCTTEAYPPPLPLSYPRRPVPTGTPLRILRPTLGGAYGFGDDRRTGLFLARRYRLP